MINFNKLKIKKSLSSNKIIGIFETNEYLAKKYGMTELKEKISIKTRQYAKRQATWARGHMSDWTRLSEIITYDLNGFPSHAGYISMSSWSWAPSLSIGESCREIPQPQMEPATCYIPPCGE